MYLKGVHTLVFDFDGVFTNNKVYVSELGQELVQCDRGDGLAISYLKKFIDKNSLNIKLLILSTEKNPVVTRRAQKMNLLCYQGCDNKLSWMIQYLSKNEDQLSRPFNGVVYLGNDINDLACMESSEYSFCPSDAHPDIKDIATQVCLSKGGDGFVREFIDNILLPSLIIEMKNQRTLEKTS